MKRRLFNILSALSLVLFLATAVLSARGYWVHDILSYYSNLGLVTAV